MILILTTQGWTLYEVLRYLPEHNWIAYEQALKANPILAKMAISGIVYTLGDWIAQVSSPSDNLLACILQISCFNLSACFSYLLLYIYVMLLVNLQCYEGKPLFEFDRTRMFRSGLVGFTLHGSLSHFYYQLCEVIIVVHICSFCWLICHCSVDG